jgi:lipopolysaccharide export system protein LptC
MKDRVALWFPLGIMALLAALSYWLDRSVQPSTPKRDGSTRHDPDYIVESFNATRLAPDGTPRYVLAAAKMTHYPDDDSTHLERPHFTQLEKTQAPLHIMANSGRVSSNGKHVHFDGNVQIIREAYGNYSRFSLNTEYLHLIPDQEVATTDKLVTIHEANTIVTAVGLKLDGKHRVLKLTSRVNAHYEKPKKK